MSQQNLAIPTACRALIGPSHKAAGVDRPSQKVTRGIHADGPGSDDGKKTK